ncbi:aminotransferase class V-fold PLP-dependent enzyme [Maricaulis sp.]|uniref:aminotransferase class V-fold PLP-dependent enzyme n=1 Tax=Maricaulis sp. TaxID=1486257 RepID=UPI002634A3BF|nr:aminotransferase class V-fold PLP-dependent enzyme [Maricaulis sp.]
MIPSQRALFDLPREVTYFNAAYMGPMPRHAAKAGAQSYADKQQPWKLGIQDAFIDAPEHYRALGARLFGARADDIAIVPAASYGLALAARNLEPDAGSEILVLDGQFPSNVYVWQALAERTGAKVRTVSRSDNESWTEAVLAAISIRTAILACPQVHWSDGGQLDLARISDAARRQGAALVLDLTQSLGALPFDLDAIQPDFAVAAGYKWLLGPYSLGLCYIAPHHQESAEALEENWINRQGSEDFARLVDYQSTYQPGARRFDMGERANFQLIPAGIASLQLILDWGVDNIATTLGHKTQDIIEAVAPMGLIPATPDRAPHYLGLAVPPQTPGDLVKRLAAEQVYLSQRGTRLRITPHLYNDETDVTRLVEVLKVIL